MPASADTAIGNGADNNGGRGKMLRDCAKSLKRSQSAFGLRIHSLESGRSHNPDDIVPTSLPLSSSLITPLQFKRGLQRAAGFATMVAAIAVAQGCVAASTASIPEAIPEARVIVRFRPGSPDPSDAAFRARLASSAHVARIDLLHAMSGDAYVMTVACADPTSTTMLNSSDTCAAAIKRLGATAGVASVENDGREKHQ